MSNYAELKKEAKKLLRGLKTDTSYLDAITVCKAHGIPVKTAAEFEVDYGRPYDVSKPARLYVVGSNSTIYYNPEYEHVDFAILHEFLHPLRRNVKDGQAEEDEVNILACMLLCLPERMIREKIFWAEEIPDKRLIGSAKEIAKELNIPEAQAEKYYFYLRENDEKYRQACDRYFKNDYLRLTADGVILGSSDDEKRVSQRQQEMKREKKIRRKARRKHVSYKEMLYQEGEAAKRAMFWLHVSIVLFAVFVIMTSVFLNSWNKSDFAEKLEIESTYDYAPPSIHVIPENPHTPAIVDATELLYHRKDCSLVLGDNLGHTVTMTKEEAVNLGYKPHHLCHTKEEMKYIRDLTQN